MRRFTRLTSPEVCTRSLRRRFRFRLAGFFVRMWLLYALFFRTFPEPVTLKRFAAPLCVFIFMGVISPSFRCEDHGHVLPLELRIRLDLSDVGELGRDPVEHFLAQLRVRDLT